MKELMPKTEPKARKQPAWLRETLGPATVAQVMDEVEDMAAQGGMAQFHPVPTGFRPLDDILNGGLRPGELMVIGGPYGVGKTILGLQIARNVVSEYEDHRALYICYEHSRAHLLSRLICLESAEQKNESALTLRQLSQLSPEPHHTSGLISELRHNRRYANVVRAIDGYGRRLVLAKASGAYTTLQEIQRWVDALLKAEDTSHLLVVVDYLQKVPVDRDLFQTEDEVTTYLTHGLKELALSRGIQMMAIAAADRLSLHAKRMRLSDMRGSSALQYETDIGLVLNNKYDIVSREHLIYNLTDAESMRNWVVLSVEKNRAGRHAVDMEFTLDAAHFRIVPQGDFVRERLIDGKAVVE
jgi:replicative DNA helicase